MQSTMAKLTIKQRKLVDEYIKTGNAAQAAINAGYSTKTAKTTAWQTLNKPAVKEYQQARVKQLEDESVADMKEVRQRLTTHARGQVYDETVVTLKVPEVQDVPDNRGGYRKQVVYVEHVKVVKTKIKPADQLKALELLGKTGAIFTDKTDISANIAPITIVDDIKAE